MSSSELQVVYRDDALLVLDKPAGLLSVPGRGEDKQDCLSARVQRQFADALIVHRLDMATSGLMIMARGITNQRMLSNAFASREVVKRYIAVVDGLMSCRGDDWNEINLPIAVDWPNRPLRIIDTTSGKPSLTRWRKSELETLRQTIDVQKQPNTTRLELEPLTGRSHQLRVHLKALGHAILGDALYASPEVQSKSDRLLLHAFGLTLQHPVTGEPIAFQSAPPF
jgi:tRNA pseudouridine32 synthase / 23S rRNA pseudouridine746 synthase